MLLLLVLPMAARAADLSDLLSGQTIPLSLQLKDLNADWRRFSLSGANGSDLLLQAMGAMTGQGMGVYYTKGQTTMVSGENYLIAYQRPVQQSELRQMMEFGRNRVTPEPFTAHSKLVLCLLNLHTSGSLTGIEQFNLDQEIRETTAASDNQRTGPNETAAIGGMKELNSAEAQYRTRHRRYGSLAELGKSNLIDPALQAATSPSTPRNGYWYSVAIKNATATTNYYAVAHPVGKQGTQAFYTDESGVIFASPIPAGNVPGDTSGQAPGPKWTVVGS